MVGKDFLEQQQRLTLTKEDIERRFQAASFGENAKEWTRRWLAVESYGQVGLGLFNLPPMIESTKRRGYPC